MVLHLTAGLAAVLRGWAQSADPRECCGAMVGRGGETSRWIDRLVPLPNVAAEPWRCYEIDSTALLDLHRQRLRPGEQVVGYYHSHPTGDAVPSERDRRAAWPELSYLIIAVEASSDSSMRSWHLVGERFVEQLLSIEEPAPIEEPGSIGGTALEGPVAPEVPISRP